MKSETSAVNDIERLPAWRRRKEHREPEILEAARGLLEECGYEGASMTEIARRAGVSEATLYKYFQNKQDLLYRVIRGWMEPGIDALEGEIALVEGTRARLRLVAVRHLRAMAQTPRLHRVVYQELRWSNYYGSPLHRLNQRYTRIVLWIIEEGMRAGELRADTDPQVVRDMFYGGLEHVGWRTVLAHRAVDVESSAVAVADLVFASVASPPSEAAPDRLDRIAGRLESAVAALGPVLVSPASRGA